MPEYANGAEADLGDFVQGIPENVGKSVRGQIIQIEEHAAPNALVAFIEITEVPLFSHDPSGVVPATIVKPGAAVKTKLHLRARFEPADISKFVLLSPPDVAAEPHMPPATTDPKGAHAESPPAAPPAN